jgi:hypothetical protein
MPKELGMIIQKKLRIGAILALGYFVCASTASADEPEKCYGEGVCGKAFIVKPETSEHQGVVGVRPKTSVEDPVNAGKVAHTNFYHVIPPDNNARPTSPEEASHNVSLYRSSHPE